MCVWLSGCLFMSFGFGRLDSVRTFFYSFAHLWFACALPDLFTAHPHSASAHFYFIFFCVFRSLSLPVRAFNKQCAFVFALWLGSTKFFVTIRNVSVNLKSIILHINICVYAVAIGQFNTIKGFTIENTLMFAIFVGLLSFHCVLITTDSHVQIGKPHTHTDSHARTHTVSFWWHKHVDHRTIWKLTFNFSCCVHRFKLGGRIKPQSLIHMELKRLPK